MLTLVEISINSKSQSFLQDWITVRRVRKSEWLLRIFCSYGYHIFVVNTAAEDLAEMNSLQIVDHCTLKMHN